MGMQHHTIKIEVVIDDHGGQREVNDKDMLMLLYRRLGPFLSSESFKGIQPMVLTTPEDVM